MVAQLVSREGQHGMRVDVNDVRAVYLGDQRTEIVSADRRFTVGRRTQAGPPDSEICPIDLIAAGFAA